MSQRPYILNTDGTTGSDVVFGYLDMGKLDPFVMWPTDPMYSYCSGLYYDRVYRDMALDVKTMREDLKGQRCNEEDRPLFEKLVALTPNDILLLRWE